MKLKCDLIIVDAFSQLFRYFHALPPLKDGQGRPTGALFGVLKLVFRLLDFYQPRYFVFAFDSKGESLRRQRYADYKIQRDPMPDELIPQVDFLKTFLSSLNIRFFEEEGYEADDIIATIVRFFQKKDFVSGIVSSDKDLMQLVDDRTFLIQAKEPFVEFDCVGVFEKMGVYPHQITDLLALMGDRSDNIPGVPGVGQKTASQLLNLYPSLDQIYQFLDQIKGKKREKLEENEELARLSYDLVQLDHCPSLDDFSCDLIAYERQISSSFIDLCSDYSLRYFVKNFSQKVNTDDLFKESKQEELFSLDFSSELVLLEERQGNLETLFFLLDQKEGHFIFLVFNENLLFIHYSEKKSNSLRLQYCYDLPLSILSKQIVEKISSLPVAFVYDLKGLYHLCPLSLPLSSCDSLYDLKIIFHLLSGADGDFSIDLKSHQEVESFVKAVCQALTFYLNSPLKKQIESFYNKFEFPLIKLLFLMEKRGIKVCLKTLTQLGNKTSCQIQTLTSQVYDMLGESFNLNSPKQLSFILFERLKLPTQKKTKMGYSTDSSVLEKLKDDHPAIRLILEIRMLTKLQTTYIESLSRQISLNSCIHTTFLQTGTLTGRLSSENPNLQNIPIRYKEGREIRSAFWPREGCLFLSVDYSQIELRVLAHLSEDVVMCQAFSENRDIHLETAILLFDCSEKEVTVEQRSFAKAINFGLIYGKTAFGLSSELSCSVKEAQKFIDNYFDSFPSIKNFIDRVIETSRSCCYVETLYGRRRYLPPQSRRLQAGNDRMAVNTLIQGTASEIMKLSMMAVHKNLCQNNLSSQILLQIHDEILLEVPFEEYDEVSLLVVSSMESVVSLRCPLSVNLSSGENWSSVH